MGVVMAVEELQSVVRFRVSFPKQAYARLQVLADKLAMPVPDLVRVMASVQLVQWEMAYLNPRAMLADTGTLEQRFNQSAEDLFPELKKE